MTGEEFRERAKEYLYLDGATGSNLVRAGMPSGVCPEQWILDHREVLLSLQKSYVEAGTDILYAPTFTANRIKLSEYGLENRLEELTKRLVALSREAAAFAADRKVYVAGDLTMTGRQLKPVGDMELETLIHIYKEQILALEKAGADLLAVETMMSLGEARAALLAAKEVSRLPVMVTLTFEEDGRTLYGTDAGTAAVVLESLGACAVGVNCSAGPGKMRRLVEEMTGAVRRIPIVAKPNAGLPYLDGQGRTCYDMDADTFAQEMEELTQAGATVLGGCCGTTPAFIKNLRERFGRQIKRRPPHRPEGVRVLASERKTLRFGLEDGFFVVGERINPTGKKQLQQQLREGSMDKVALLAEEQEKCGAQVLDINMGMSGIDEKAMMLRAIEEVSGVTTLPLSLDSSHVDVLEAALRRYPGRALINSISLEREKFEKLIPLAKKYGAMFILLPLSDRGLPESLEEKKEIIEKILDRAYACGLEKEDIVVDGLAAAVGADSRAGLNTLATIRYCKERGLATVCGLSNISFGMPMRPFVNAAFLALAIREGLTMAIANPSQELMMCCAAATDLLLDKKGADLRYIACAQTADQNRQDREEAIAAAGKQAAQKETSSGGESSAGTEPALGSPLREELYLGVLKGNRNGAAALTKKALEAGEAPRELFNRALLPAINRVGELFEQGKYFLPQLIASAEAMKNAIQVIEPLLAKQSDRQDMPVVVIATVEGDIHDIGKNLVALMLKNYGFQVIDLGKDVPAQTIVDTAIERGAGIIALSALMTTTMQRMREVVELVRKRRLSVKVMIGGAVITRDYAEEIGADGYSRDAAEAVRLAKRLAEKEISKPQKQP